MILWGKGIVRVSTHQQFGAQFIQLHGRRRHGLLRVAASLLYVLQLPGQLIHFGHGHGQFFLFLVEQRSDRFQVGGYKKKTRTLII